MCWQVVVQRFEAGGDSGGYWSTIIRDQNSLAFVMEDDSGRALVEAETRENEWRSGNRRSVSVRLQDALDEGCLLYPVESIVTDRAWYLTLPAGQLSVQEV